jgi:hypothetical protein
MVYHLRFVSHYFHLIAPLPPRPALVSARTLDPLKSEMEAIDRELAEIQEKMLEP